jgi:hypothetical protein
LQQGRHLLIRYRNGAVPANADSLVRGACAAAILRAAHPDLTTAQMVSALRCSAIPIENMNEPGHLAAALALP